MDDLKPYAVFAETVAAGSMSAAGRRLGMNQGLVQVEDEQFAGQW